MKNRLRKVTKTVRNFARGLTKRVKKFFGRGGSNSMAPPPTSVPTTPDNTPPPLPPPVVGAAMPKKQRKRSSTRRRSTFKRVRNAVRNVGKRIRNTVTRVFSSKKKRKGSRKFKNYRKIGVKGGTSPVNPPGAVAKPMLDRTTPMPAISGTSAVIAQSPSGASA